MGSLLQALRDHGLDGHTLVFFTSDNGSARPPVPDTEPSCGAGAEC